MTTEEKSIVPAEPRNVEKSSADYEESATIPEEDTEPAEAPEPGKKPEAGGSEKKSSFSWSKLMIFLLLIETLALGLIGWKYFSQGSLGETEDAKEVMQERISPPLMANKLNPSLAYKLESATDIYHGLSVTVTKAQFRQDATRLWIKIDNDSGERVSMIPAANSTLVDDKGRTYRTDPFGGDQLSSIAPGAHEEIMLTFEPIRSDVFVLTYSLDGVFDMKKAPWNYSVQFSLP